MKILIVDDTYDDRNMLRSQTARQTDTKSKNEQCLFKLVNEEIRTGCANRDGM